MAKMAKLKFCILHNKILKSILKTNIYRTLQNLKKFLYTLDHLIIAAIWNKGMFVTLTPISM